MNLLTWGWVFGGAMLGLAAVLMVMLRRGRREDRTTLVPRGNEELAAIRMAARGVKDAREAYARGKGKPGEEQLLYSVDAAETVLLEAGLDMLEEGLTFEEALVVVQSGRLVGRRGRMGVRYRWETIPEGNAGILEVKVGDGRWRVFEPGPDDKAARDWVRRPSAFGELDPVSRIVVRGKPTRPVQITLGEERAG